MTNSAALRMCEAFIGHFAAHVVQNDRQHWRRGDLWLDLLRRGDRFWLQAQDPRSLHLLTPTGRVEREKVRFLKRSSKWSGSDILILLCFAGDCSEWLFRPAFPGLCRHPIRVLPYSPERYS